MIIGVFVFAAYWGGKKASEVFAESNQKITTEQREQLTQHVLKQMNSIKEGDTLPDYAFFETLESQTVRLSDLVTGPTWLIFMLPDCDECLQELEGLQSTFADPAKKTKAILISNANPLDLIDLKNRYNLNIPILHDRNTTYTDKIKVFTFPFNVLVGSKLTISKITTGHIEPENF